MVDLSEVLNEKRFSDLRDCTANALSISRNNITLEQLGPAKGIPDETLKLTVYDQHSQPVAVVLYSNPATPNMVRHSMERAIAAGEALGPDLGKTALQPIAEGIVDGLSYAVLPYLQALSKNKFVWYAQRAYFGPRILAWLRQATEVTISKHDPKGHTNNFIEPLRYIAQHSNIDSSLRIAATNTLSRLADQQLQMKHVLMHGDLWLGNIMIEPNNSNWLKGPRFVIIDWPSGTPQGYPIYDLVRLAGSLKLRPHQFRNELNRHLSILDCTPDDALSYLLSGLGYIGMTSENFPTDRYVSMSKLCFDRVKFAIT